VTTFARPAARFELPMIVMMVSAGVVMTVAMGVRQGFGLFLDPFSYENGLPITVWALSLALQNLVWGLAQPLAGALLDRYGAPVVVAIGTIAYAIGLALIAIWPSSTTMIFGMGILVGIGLACTGFGIMLAAVGRVASPAQRSKALGLAGAVGGIGQVALPPITLSLISGHGTGPAFLILSGVMLLALPFGFAMREKGLATPHPHHPTLARPPLAQLIRGAAAERGFVLLTIGFFTCGFQLAFITTYLPGYLVLCHMPPGLGATALSLIGLFNMAGSWLSGHAGARWRPQYVLGWLYIIRAIVLFGFLELPKSELTVFAFAAIMGLTWLATAPLTNGVISRLFGVRDLGALFGTCFFSHQIGSFLGAWLGGYTFAITGSYDLLWMLTAAAGVFAAALHFPIRDRAAVQPA
jgi:MFS family permease